MKAIPGDFHHALFVGDVKKKGKKCGEKTNMERRKMGLLKDEMNVCYAILDEEMI